MTDLFQDKLQAAAYAKYRTGCPEKALNETLEFLKQKSSSLKLALDVGCGTGLLTRQLAPHFERVLGTDVSDAQLEHARNHPNNPTNIEYQKGTAETFDLEDNSVDLVSVGTALHWFDVDRFCAEVKRVLVPNGVLMVWGDHMQEIVVSDEAKSKELNSVVMKFIFEDTAPYRDPRVYLVSESYENIKFPFETVIRQKYEFDLRRTMRELLGRSRSASATQTMMEVDPELAEKVLKHMEDRSLEILGNLDTDIICRMNGILILCRNSEV